MTNRHKEIVTTIINLSTRDLNWRDKHFGEKINCKSPKETINYFIRRLKIHTHDIMKLQGFKKH